MIFPSIWITLTVFTYGSCTELVPERYLRPRDFNHHPFTDVGSAAALKSVPSLPETHPYAILASKKPREGRQFPDQDVVLYPNPPAEVLPRKLAPAPPIPAQVQVQAQPVTYDVDPYSHVPKNYAFSYSVKDQHSGDDFSHSQAHNGKATKGQYRVKLPDGRIQVVSYTADHKGYRADVQYEGESAKHYAPPAPPTAVYEHHTPAPETFLQKQPAYTVSPANYGQEQSHYTPTPSPYVQEQPTYTVSPAAYGREQSHYTVTSAPSYTAKPSLFSFEPSYTPTPATYVQQHQYSPTPSTYGEHEYVQTYARPTSGYEGPYASQAPSHYDGEYASPTPAAYDAGYPSPTPAAYDARYPSPTPAAYAHETYQSPAPETYNHQQEYQSPAYPTASPGLQAYASPSPTRYEQHRYSGSEYETGFGPSSPSPFSVQPYLRSTPAPFTKQKIATASEGPVSGNGQVLVTPRTLFNAALSRRGFGDRQHVIYKFSSPS